MDALRSEAQKKGGPVPLRLSLEQSLFSVARNMIKSFSLDLAAAAIPNEDERGRTVDLHALRRTFGQMTECTLEQTIITQQRMFARRGVEQTQDDVALLGAVYELTRQERRWTSDPPVL